MDFQYLASGELIARFCIGAIQDNSPRRNFIIVRRERGDYVVALYFDGESEWDSGYYTPNLDKAIARFNLLISTAIGCPPVAK